MKRINKALAVVLALLAVVLCAVIANAESRRAETSYSGATLVMTCD